MFRQLFFFFILSLLLTSFFSCQKDVQGCTDPDSDNYNSLATIDDFSCIPPRFKFFGTYEVNETCNSVDKNWSLSIYQATMIEVGMVLENIGGAGDQILVAAKGNKFNFDDKENDIHYKGSGTLVDNTLTLTYTASFAGLSHECTAICIKQ